MSLVQASNILDNIQVNTSDYAHFTTNCAMALAGEIRMTSSTFQQGFLDDLGTFEEIIANWTGADDQ